MKKTLVVAAMVMFVFFKTLALAGAATATYADILSWSTVTSNTDGTPCLDLAGYNLYSCSTTTLTTCSNFAQISTIAGTYSAVVSTVTYTASGTLPPNVTLARCYRVTAKDNAVPINESGPSNVACKSNTGLDTIAPVVTAFSIPATATILTVPINTFTATDAVGVTGYMVNETVTAPASTDAGWSTTKPTSYTFASAGVKTLRAWAKDAAGNVSTSANAVVTITLPDTTIPNVPTNFNVTTVITIVP